MQSRKVKKKHARMISQSQNKTMMLQQQLIVLQQELIECQQRKAAAVPCPQVNVHQQLLNAENKDVISLTSTTLQKKKRRAIIPEISRLSSADHDAEV